MEGFRRMRIRNLFLTRDENLDQEFRGETVIFESREHEKVWLGVGGWMWTINRKEYWILQQCII